MNEWMFNDTPAQKHKSAIGCQTNGIVNKKLNGKYGYIKNNNMVIVCEGTSFHNLFPFSQPVSQD